MSFTMQPPTPLEKIDADLLGSLKDVLPPMGEIIYGRTPLFDAIAEIAGVTDLEDEWRQLGRAGYVRSFFGQVVGKGWHVDLAEGFLVADTLPTEFLVAEEDVIKRFWKSQISKSDPIDIHPERLTARRIANCVQFMSARRLKMFGFEVWTPEPLEVVPFTVTDIHNSTVNPTQHDVWRNFALLYREA